MSTSSSGKAETRPGRQGLFFLLWLGSFISAIGSGMTAFALGVHVFQQTGSAAGTGAITLAGFLPALVLAPLAGLLADRYDRRWLMVLGDGLSALGLAYIYFHLNAGQLHLLLICLCLAFNAACASLIEPAFKATITELLPKEDYTRASGLMQLTASAKYLVSPLLAGILLVVTPVQTILLLDILTVLLTVSVSFAIGRQLRTADRPPAATSLLADFKEGWQVFSASRGLCHLVSVSVALSFFMGLIQVLFTPLVLSFSDSKFLGFALTVSATGLLAASLLLGLFRIRSGFHRLSTAALLLAGSCMLGLAWWENKQTICIFGFLFFAMLAIVNSAFDYLTRTNVAEEKQGRVWGLIGLLSQLGYVLAYALAGKLADDGVKPWLAAARSDFWLVRLLGSGESLPYRTVIAAAGLGLLVIALVYGRLSTIRRLEETHV